MSASVKLIAGPQHAGTRLDTALAALADVGSRAAAQRLIAAGRVTVDGRRVPKRHALCEGERVVAELAPAPTAAAASGGEGVPYEVVLEDDHLLVVDKPAGVVVHPAPGHREGTLSQALRARGARGGDAWRPGIVHRLDKDTSGLLVVSKSDPVQRALADLIRDRRLRREYLALVDGAPDALSGTIDAPLGRDRRQRTVTSTQTDRPREARTHFRRLEALPRSTLLEVHLETGRTHQIRAHLAAIGHPVLGDPAYGGQHHRLGLERQFLHAARLAFPHPLSGQPVDCSSALPADLERALDAARDERGARV